MDGVRAAQLMEIADGELVLEALEVLGEDGVVRAEEVGEAQEVQADGGAQPTTQVAVVAAVVGGAHLIVVLEGEGGTCKPGTLTQVTKAQ